MRFPIRVLNRRLYHPNALEYQGKLNLLPLTYGSDSLQYKVLDHSLKTHVPSYGFSERALVASINDLGLGSSVLSALGASNSPSLFNSSPAVLELVKFHLVTKRSALTSSLDPTRTPEVPQQLPTLETLFQQRLELNKPVAPHLSQLLSMLSIPGEFLVKTALPELHSLSDDMVYFSQAHDSHDFAWYSKRAAISCAFVSSELFMAQDKSHNFNDTFEFAAEKLHNVTKLGQYYTNTEEYMWYTLLMSINLAKSQLARG
ncbi:LANO_0E01156g1_1 [Lachancea nothofagi CBS 11611]|uniref:Ubiquinone biosynthesis protein n=1 Tax=Lachancea nothofagi CBS 11611 TaxID=1266666 RepID=A0A1G4JPJ7_9SACH|nr:LANO_0E01156g1_1 [Lachancea nothofagi CBS 11611]